MHACRRIQDAGFRFGECGRFHIAVIAAARHDYPANARGGSSLKNLISIIIETGVREVCANIYQ